MFAQAPHFIGHKVIWISLNTPCYIFCAFLMFLVQCCGYLHCDDLIVENESVKNTVQLLIAEVQSVKCLMCCNL